MSWTFLTKRTLGTNVPKSWLDTIVDNLTHLFNLMGGAGTGAGGSLQNGSFENDVDSDGIPDGWTQTLYTGGSAAFDSLTPGHGAKAYSFTSPGGTGNGGGYLTSDDYITCTANRPITVGFLLRSTAAGCHNAVDVLWYDYAKAYLSTTSVHDDQSTNPTSWTRFAPSALPPAGACFCKIRPIGAKNDNTTAATVSYDGMFVKEDGVGILRGTIAEGSRDGFPFVDVGYVTITLPVLSAAGLVRVTLQGQAKNPSGGGVTSQKFRIGTNYSTVVETSSASYVSGVHVIHAIGAGGSVALYQQLASADFIGYGKMDMSEISIEVLAI